ncbi:NAD(P)-binding protein [Punctularia strigosozonata HHB-11173 SS5]|uniref:NAD(P)-binding protein n=1 Tax=Punctularia strigosozonata (strain HHB-11173) TaxID=741275 RepID=UPI0004417C9E|nr:NAD(P)-binding protein [Punctularia strigosozonata HHB-11173 SS5]EIN07651.1 NAD(P)-binding protein [Punctularia strigosozonata HHB-11173 SS5]
MPSLTEAQAYNAAALSALSTVPTALFIGGTSGIGRGIVEAFARHTKGNVHIIICGRNREAADRIIASLPKPSVAAAKHEFVYCEATLMRNVRAVTSELISRLPKLNYLVFTIALVNLNGYEPTEEGLEKKAAASYYARWLFTLELLPLLRKAREMAEPAKLLSIGSAGRAGRKIETDDDLDLRKLYKTSIFQIRKTITACQELSLEAFVTENPWLTTIHTNPGVVYTPSLPFDVPLLLKVVIDYVAWILLRSPSDSGEFMLYALLKGEGEGRVLRFGETGKTLRRRDEFITVEGQERVWKHTLEAISV